MNFTFSEEQQALRDSARAFLGDHCSPERVREVMQSVGGFDEPAWRRIAEELGWAAITVPEEYGGLGLGYIELVALMEEMGAYLLCSPFFATVCLGANALIVGADETQKQRYLPAIAAGEKTATLAITDKSDHVHNGPNADSVRMTAAPQSDGYVLDGAKRYVVDGHAADVLLVAARLPDTTGADGICLFAVDADSAGIATTALTTVDQTRRQAEIVFRNTPVPASARIGAAGTAWPIIEKTLQLAAIALAAEQVGGAQRCLDMTVQYAKERVQFGRPIASFQAIKHKCADMLLEVESARSAAYYAGWAAATDDAELPVLASLAKAYCSQAYFHCAAESIQIHGGVGFTWEYDCHLHFKRAKAGEQLLGTPAYHRELVARRIGL